MNGGMKRKGMMVATLGILLPLAACYEHTFTVGGGASPRAPVVYDQWENFWLGGLIGHTKVDLQDICPSGRATIEAKQTFLNGLVTGLTSGIYSPTTLRVRCQDGRRTDVELDEAEVASIVADPDFVLWVGVEMPERQGEVAAAQTALSNQ